MPNSSRFSETMQLGAEGTGRGRNSHSCTAARRRDSEPTVLPAAEAKALTAERRLTVAERMADFCMCMAAIWREGGSGEGAGGMEGSEEAKGKQQLFSRWQAEALLRGPCCVARQNVPPRSTSHLSEVEALSGEAKRCCGCGLLRWETAVG